jgi:hypothetical protein
MVLLTREKSRQQTQQKSKEELNFFLKEDPRRSGEIETIIDISIHVPATTGD